MLADSRNLKTAAGTMDWFSLYQPGRERRRTSFLSWFDVGCLTPVSLAHLVWASATTFGERVALLPDRRSVEPSWSPRGAAYGQRYIAAKGKFFVCKHFHSPSRHPPRHLPCIHWDSVWSFSRSSAGMRVCDGVRALYVRSQPKPETCGVFKPAGLPTSPTSRPVSALKWGPSAECLCAGLSNPHEDPSRLHKFIETTNQV